MYNRRTMSSIWSTDDLVEGFAAVQIYTAIYINTS